MVQNLRAGLLLVDPEGHIQFVNSYFRELFGLATEDTIAEVYPPPPNTISIKDAFQRPAEFSTRAQVLQAAGQTVLNEEFVLANGRVVELDYLVLDQGQAGRLICYRDVTERHGRENQLRMLSYMQEQNPNPILRLAPDGAVVYANPAAAPLVQILAADVPTALRQQLLTLVQTALGTAAPHQQELAVAEQHYLVTVVAVPTETYATLYLTDITARQQVEQQLAEQRVFYETILAEVPIAVSVMDADFRYRFVNPAVEPDPVLREWLLGKTSEESCRYRQVSQATMELRQRAFEKAMAQKREVTWEEMLINNSKPRHMLRRLRPIVEPDGTIRLLVSSGLDITARKQAEEKVAQQQEFYESILNLLPVDIAVFDAGHRYLFVNPASISDPVTRRQVIGMTNAEYCAFRSRPAEITQQREQIFAQAVSTRTDVAWEETLWERYGQQRTLRCLRPVFHPDGSLRWVVGSGLDITARYAAEERQRQSEALIREQQALIRLIVDTLPSVVYVMEPDESIVFTNKAFENLASRSEHIQPYDQQSAEVREQIHLLRTWREQVMTTQNPLATEMPFTLLTGEVRHQQVHMRPLQRTENDGAVLVVCTDITDLKQAQQAAEENAHAKETFLARMSHEIRTPLNGILGMANLLRKTPLTVLQQEYLHTMQRAGQHLLALVNDVLDMAKITANHLQLDQTPFDLTVTLEGARQTVAALAEEKGLALVMAPLPLPGTQVVGDAYRLHQVLLNLLSNAIKFTEHGSVQLGADVVEDTPDVLTLRFWVRDTGIGIVPEQQTHIFEAFTQASAETSQQFGGTGLGLAISEQLVHHMGGTLRLCSEPGQGTTFSFTLTLPKVVQTGIAPEPAPAMTYEALRGLRVLLAEDNMVNQWLATVMLEHWGVQVEAVSNGLDALAQLKANPYDVAILDIQMPGLSGVGVTTALRQYPDPARAAVPILALTANAFETQSEGYLAAGMNACLTKPFEEADLCQVLLQLSHEATRF
ncbi:hypothetical protein GCM10011383_22510 [Hymenobacter cavernae]|uniref:histidine kinase n=1 Tax=Hymenobacter cavernae TaxID=2044852 RepID=A0ABQ1U8Y2_9BACT|nr:hypothetical protein GCM10011383_22510 [Hymenobacter cavernae]